MFKRPRLSATSPLVNASFALGLLFLAASCGQSSQSSENSGDPAPEAAPEIEEKTETGLSLPAVWNTSPLAGPVTSVGVAGQLGSTIALSYADGGLQLFSFEGDRITDKADLGVKAVGDGRYLLLGQAPMTLFPGIDQAGGMNAYLHGGDLPEPVPLDLDTREMGIASGLCSAGPVIDSDGLLKLAFWTEEAPSTLQSGRVLEIGETLVLLLDEPVQADQPITACILEETGATVFSAPIQNVSVLERNGRRHTITLDTSGNFNLLRRAGTAEKLTIRDGLSVRMPSVPTAMAGTGDARGSGYTGGILVVTGEVTPDEYRAVLIDPSDITLDPLGRPALLPE